MNNSLLPVGDITKNCKMADRSVEVLRSLDVEGMADLSSSLH
jgi:hypothetical protein